jgi:hypothetical protein
MNRMRREAVARRTDKSLRLAGCQLEMTPTLERTRRKGMLCAEKTCRSSPRDGTRSPGPDVGTLVDTVDEVVSRGVVS